jgi:hypothetical protein
MPPQEHYRVLGGDEAQVLHELAAVALAGEEVLVLP